MRSPQDTLLVGYFKKHVTSYDQSKSSPSLAKVKAAILSLTGLKQMEVARLIGTKYDVYKAQRYRQDYKDLEEFHRRQFASYFVEELVRYAVKHFKKGSWLAHNDADLYVFSDITIFSDDLWNNILDRIAVSNEVTKILEESESLRSVFLNDVLLLIMNMRKGNIRVDKNGKWESVNPKIIEKKSAGLTVFSLEERFQGNDVNLGLWLANLIRKSWGADSEIVKKDFEAFLKEITV